MNKWQALKEYINSKEIGTIITRKEMLTNLDNPKKFCTVDTYKGILLRLGIIESYSNGKYKLLYHIKPDLTSSEAKKVVDSNSWRLWFNDFKVKT